MNLKTSRRIKMKSKIKNKSTNKQTFIKMLLWKKESKNGTIKMIHLLSQKMIRMLKIKKLKKTRNKMSPFKNMAGKQSLQLRYKMTHLKSQ